MKIEINGKERMENKGGGWVSTQEGNDKVIETQRFWNIEDVKRRSKNEKRGFMGKKKK